MNPAEETRKVVEEKKNNTCLFPPNSKKGPTKNLTLSCKQRQQVGRNKLHT